MWRNLPDLHEAKRIVTIPLMWRLLGLAHPPPMTGGVSRSPFRQDTKPSFSVFNGSDGISRFKDHATDESGDVVDFVCRTRSCEPREAILLVRSVAAVFQLDKDDPRRVALLATCRVTNPGPEQAAAPVVTRPNLDGLVELTDTALELIVRQRGFDCVDGLRLATERGILRGEKLSGGDVAWVMTDAEGRHASRRLLSGEAFTFGQKAMAVKGSCASWPIGLADAKDRAHVVICEGGPDTLAAFTLLAAGANDGTLAGTPDDNGVVMMGGASCSIAGDALELFQGKTVTLVPHLDDAGLNGAAKWATQLKDAGALVDVFDLTPHLTEGGKDLNDALRANNNLKLFSNHE